MTQVNKKKLPMGFEFKKVWGPLIWSFMHTMAYVADLDPTYRRRVLAFFENMVLPCSICQSHYTKELPVQLTNTAFPLSWWVYKLHRKVSKRVKGSKYIPPPFKHVLRKAHDTVFRDELRRGLPRQNQRVRQTKGKPARARGKAIRPRPSV